MSKPKPTRYRTTNWSSYNAALKKRGYLTVWFDPSMNWEGLPTGRRGRRQSDSDAAIQTCLTLKVLFGFALRQTTEFVESLLPLAGLAWSVPDFSTLSRRQEVLTVDIAYRGSNGPLPLLIDSTGIKVEGEGEWHRRKHGGSKRRLWRKLPIGIDAGSLEIRAVEMTGNEIGDAPVLPALLEQIPEDEDIASVTADGAYDTRRSHETIASRSAQAVIPPRKNATPWRLTSPGAIARNDALQTCKHLGRANWRRWSGYHRRSRVETKMHCIQRLGQRLTARDFDRQLTVHIRVAILNRFTALGTPVTHAVA
ncbi:transposase [Kozakia baliensis]|uniref:Transposase n=2 Tax=Kozakia baliensis TaxID=153496 RepID=A0A1D8USK4_9PROT|nr:IS5 family transposase [Kozakia baliensis]AOX16624.1 transposase [Kozakia baliensis]